MKKIDRKKTETQIDLLASVHTMESSDRKSRGRRREDASFPAPPSRLELPEGYADLVGEIKRRIQTERLRTIMAANWLASCFASVARASRCSGLPLLASLSALFSASWAILNRVCASAISGPIRSTSIASHSSRGAATAEKTADFRLPGGSTVTEKMLTGSS